MSAETGETVTADAAESKTWDDTANSGIKVTGSSLIKYTSHDAKNGFTPNSSTGIFSVTVKNSAVVGTKGGWYNISVKIGGTTKNTSSVYVYAPQSETPSVGKPEITYAAGDEIYVSGLVYDKSGEFTLEVEDIKHTQQSMTTTLNRLALTDNKGDVSFKGTITTANLTLVEGSASNETAVYKYTKTVAASPSSPKKVTCGISAQAYGQSAVAGTKLASDVCTATTWLYPEGATEDKGDMTSLFVSDGARVNGNLDSAIAGTTSVYDSTKSLVTDYTDQLLVQDNALKYPNADSTGRYSGCTGTRYFVRPVKFTDKSGQINKISVTVSGWDKDYQLSKARIYLLKQGASDKMVLNCYSKDSISYGTPISTQSTITGGTWICEINNDLWQLVGKTEGYYLAVEMDGANNTTLGQITVAQADS